MGNDLSYPRPAPFGPSNDSINVPPIPSPLPAKVIEVVQPPHHDHQRPSTEIGDLAGVWYQGRIHKEGWVWGVGGDGGKRLGEGCRCREWESLLGRRRRGASEGSV